MTIVVLGSLNQDIVISTARAPQAGETLLAHGHVHGFGGKGANQAVAATRLGGQVNFIGRVGQDPQGSDYLELLHQEGIGTEHVTISSTVPTGQAVVILEDDGQNRILVSPGSNAEIAQRDVENARALIQGAKVVLAQLEIPIPSVQLAFEMAQGIRILNAAPALIVPQSLLDATDVLIVNESELASIIGAPQPQDPAQAIAGAQLIRGPKAVVVTLGGQGAIGSKTSGESWHQPGLEVDVVDTTAAGDAFCGALAVGLVGDASLEDALKQAIKVSALVVTKSGALNSLPNRQELHETYGGWIK
ncbi:ribokinase [Jonesiaceae bacterium BS-20]|uniref:Ribokinase n=1 Tax=Jonesiaceae bacterium BS-20 TaxID=3120821 RepID=A0AAU7DXC5_9MICO